VFGNVLVNGVVGETSKGVDGFVDMNFGLRDAPRFGDAENAGGDRVKIALRAQTGNGG